MADVATLGIKVENGEVVKATTSLNDMAVAGGKSEAAAQRLTRRMALLEIEARNMNAQMAGAKQAAFQAEMAKSAEATAKLEMAARRADVQLEKTGRTGMGAASAIRSAFAALGLGLIVREFSSLSDSYTNLHSRLALVTTGTGNLAAVQKELFDVAQRTRTSFEGTADLYGRIARNAAQLGVSQREILTVTETVSKAMIISGGSAETNRAAIVQLGQALASGTLRGDELNSVMEQSPRLAQAIAEGLGVTIGQLRAMGKEGKLTSEEVVRALLRMRDTIDKEFTQLPTTIGGAWQQLRNEILNTVGAANEAGGMSGGIVTAIDAIRAAIPPAFKLANQFFGGISIGSADAALSLERVRQKLGEIQLAIGLTLKARGLPGGDFLIGNAAKVLKDGDDILRMLEKQREEVIKHVHAITEAGTVSNNKGKPKPGIDPKAAEEEAKRLKELQKATDAYYNSLNQHQIDAIKSIGTMREQNAATREMIAATMEGPAAVEALTVAQAGANAVRELGVGVTEKVAAAVRREAEEQARLAIQLGHVKDAQAEAAAAAKKAEDEAKRDRERRARELQRATSNAIEQGITDVVNGKNPLIALADGFKRAMIHAISEALAERFLASKFAEMLGVGTGGAATKQVAAGSVMLQAATLQMQAATLMAGGTVFGGLGETMGGHGGIADASAGGASSGRLGTAMSYAGIVAGAGIAGYGAGQSAGGGVHSGVSAYIRGGLGGAASGALAGAAIGSIGGPPGAAVGAVVGALVGLVAGLKGTKDALDDFSAAALLAREAVKNTMDGLRATVAKDALGASIAQINQERTTIAKSIQDAYANGNAGSATVKERNRQLAELNKLEDERIRQLKEEAAVMQTRQIEDYTERTLRAQGKTKEADDYHFALTQQRERDDLVRSFGAEIDAREQQILAAYDQAAAAEKAAYAQNKATDAVTAFGNALRNGPSGFFIEKYLSEFAVRAQRPIGIEPPSAPNFSTSGTRTSSASAASVTFTLEPGAIQVNGNQDPDKMAADLVIGLKRRARAKGGSNVKLSAALDEM